MTSKSVQHITRVATFIEKQITFLVTFVYAFNDAIDRVPLWNELRFLSTTNLPWCALGDFNCIHSLNEVKGGDG